MPGKRLTKEEKEDIFRRHKLNESPQKIAKAIECSDVTVRTILKRGTVESPPSKNTKDFKFTLKECTEIRRQYEEEKLSTNQPIDIFNFYDSELEDLGLWQFAYTYVRMTDYQKE